MYIACISCENYHIVGNCKIGLGIFKIRVSLFCHKIQGLCFCYLLNTKSKWNKFKWEILDNSNYDNFHGGGGGGFSHLYVIMHKYFVKKLEMKKMNT